MTTAGRRDDGADELLRECETELNQSISQSGRILRQKIHNHLADASKPNAAQENDCRDSSESGRLLQGSEATESAGYLSQGSPVQPVPAYGNDSPVQSAGELSREQIEEWRGRLAWDYQAEADIAEQLAVVAELDALCSMALRAAEPADQNGTEPCCGNFATCRKACTPRGIEVGRQNEEARQRFIRDEPPAQPDAALADELELVIANNAGPLLGSGPMIARVSVQLALINRVIAALRVRQR